MARVVSPMRPVTRPHTCPDTDTRRCRCRRAHTHAGRRTYAHALTHACTYMRAIVRPINHLCKPVSHRIITQSDSVTFKPHRGPSIGRVKPIIVCFQWVMQVSLSVNMPNPLILFSFPCIMQSLINRIRRAHIAYVIHNRAYIHAHATLAKPLITLHIIFL